MKSVDGGCSPSGADQDADRFKAPVPLFGFESAIQNLHALHCFMHLIEDAIANLSGMVLRGPFSVQRLDQRGQF